MKSAASSRWVRLAKEVPKETITLEGRVGSVPIARWTIMKIYAGMEWAYILPYMQFVPTENFHSPELPPLVRIREATMTRVKDISDGAIQIV